MTAYIVKKNNRRIPNKVFESYDAARSWVRRKLRSMREEPGLFVGKGSGINAGFADFCDESHRTPQLALHGYSISKADV